MGSSSKEREEVNGLFKKSLKIPKSVKKKKKKKKKEEPRNNKQTPFSTKPNKNSLPWKKRRKKNGFLKKFQMITTQ